MKVLLTGSEGQLGQAIINSKPNNIQLFSLSKHEFDLRKKELIISKLNKINPKFVINCGAFTNVDLAETDRKLATNINSSSVREICNYLKEKGGGLIQISTDYVFNGNKSIAYKVDDRVSPINHYGYTKAKAEEYIQDILKEQNQAIIIRTSWLMGPVKKNFLLTMLKLHQEKEIIEVVSDQISCPTSTKTLAKACWKSILINQTIHSFYKNSVPTLHWCDNGLASWYDVAITIGELAKELGLTTKSAHIQPIKSSKYFSKAKRPNFSLLDCELSKDILEIKGIHWRTTIKESLNTIIRE